MCIRIVFLCPSCRAPSGQTTTLRLHGPSCWNRVLVERLMQFQHFHPSWYCTTPNCGYSRANQERDAKEIKQIRLNQARNDTSSDADDELYDTEDERDEAMEDSEADADTKPANPESGRLVTLQPGPSIYYPSAKLRMPVGLDRPTRDRVGELLSRIARHADAHLEKSKWLEEEEELLEILRAHKVSYRQIAEVSIDSCPNH
ncbi:hypothetical protein VTG60DRAFT_2746 [Thermothelomyces hinnuleus]